MALICCASPWEQEETRLTIQFALPAKVIKLQARVSEALGNVVAVENQAATNAEREHSPSENANPSSSENMNASLSENANDSQEQNMSVHSNRKAERQR